MAGRGVVSNPKGIASISPRLLVPRNLGLWDRAPVGADERCYTNNPTSVELTFAFTMLACSGTSSSEFAIANTR